VIDPPQLHAAACAGGKVRIEPGQFCLAGQRLPVTLFRVRVAPGALLHRAQTQVDSRQIILDVRPDARLVRELLQQRQS